MKDKIQIAKRDPRNGAMSTIYKRNSETGSPHKKEDSRVKYFVNGEPALMVAARHGVKQAEFFQRLRRGWTCVEAATTRPRRYTKEGSK